MTKASISSCPVCENALGNLTLERRPQVPSLQNVALETPDAARTFPTGALHILRCAACGFVWNDEFDPSHISYDAGYNNDVTASPYYLAHLDTMADRILASVPEDQPIHYVEIGCGEGDFMALLHARGKGRVASLTGFDPSFTGDDNLPDGAVVHRVMFTPDQIDKIPAEANVICSRHTIEHINDVQAFAEALAASMTPERSLFLETPDADWILRNLAFQDFFYEHCSIYTPRSVATLLARHGLACEVVPAYDDQYMWISARMMPSQEASDPTLPAIDDAAAKRYVSETNQIRSQWQGYLETRRKVGPIALWGAASKGVTFSLLFNSAEDAPIDFAIDLNTAKQGCFMPITATPILPPEAARDQGVRTIIIMNPNYEAEIRQHISDLGCGDVEITVLNH